MDAGKQTMKIQEFERYFNKLYMPLCMYALRMVEDVDMADDLVQEAFVKTWESIDGGVEIGNFKAWMYRCVRNGCAAYLRSRNEYVDIAGIVQANDDAIDTSERDALIWQAVNALPEKCREIFLMSKRDGMSNDEIAEELNLSVKTVKNQLTKAFARMRDALSDGHRPFFLPFL